MAERQVLVVGAGLAGTVAALALKEAGIKVLLSGKPPGASLQCTGGWTLGASLEQLGRGQADVAAHVAALARLGASHPYARLGRERALAGVAAGWRLVHGAQPGEGTPRPQAAGSGHPEGDGCLVGKPAGVGPQAAANAGAAVSSPKGELAWLPLSTGVLVPGVPGLEQASVAAADDCAPGVPTGSRAYVLDLSAWGAPLGERAVCGWQHDAAQRRLSLPACRRVPVPVPAHVPDFAVASAVRLVHWLDEAENLAVLVAAVTAACVGLPEDGGVLWCPAVLGVRAPEEARALLARACGRAVFEVADSGGLWAPAFRRRRLLAERLSAAGIGIEAPVVSLAAGTDGGLEATFDDGSVHEVAAVILATGRFLGGGFVWPSQQPPRERLLGCQLSVDGMPMRGRATSESLAVYPQWAQAFEQMGIATDADCRPALAPGQAERLKNRVFVAGDAQGGWQERSVFASDGIALSTGYFAAVGAAAVYSAEQGGKTRG